MSEVEEWLAVVGWEGVYEVSSLGRIKSLSRPVLTSGGRTRTTKTRILEPSFCGHGYAKIALSAMDRRFYTTAHRLVAIAFIGPPPSTDHEVNHIDGNPGNNNASNLEWVTASQNQLHACRVLGKRVGEKSGKTRLTRKDVSEMRLMRSGGSLLREIAEKFGVSVSCAYDITARRSWRHVA